MGPNRLNWTLTLTLSFFSSQQLLNRSPRGAIFWGKERQRFAFATSSPCSPNSMDVIFWNLRQVIVDDMSNVIHIDTTGSNIGCNENAHQAARAPSMRRSLPRAGKRRRRSERKAPESRLRAGGNLGRSRRLPVSWTNRMAQASRPHVSAV